MKPAGRRPALRRGTRNRPVSRRDRGAPGRGDSRSPARARTQSCASHADKPARPLRSSEGRARAQAPTPPGPPSAEGDRARCLPRCPSSPTLALVPSAARCWTLSCPQPRTLPDGARDSSPHVGLARPRHGTAWASPVWAPGSLCVPFAPGLCPSVSFPPFLLLGHPLFFCLYLPLFLSGLSVWPVCLSLCLLLRISCLSLSLRVSRSLSLSLSQSSSPSWGFPGPSSRSRKEGLTDGLCREGPRGLHFSLSLPLLPAPTRRAFRIGVQGGRPAEAPGAPLPSTRDSPWPRTPASESDPRKGKWGALTGAGFPQVGPSALPSSRGCSPP